MRGLHLGTPPMQGDDVKALQKVLAGANVWKKKFYYGKIDGIYKTETAKAVKAAKHYLGYPKAKENTLAGDTLNKYLNGHKRLPKWYQWRHHDRNKPNYRALIVKECAWGIKNTVNIHYKQERPMPLKQWKKHKLDLTTDCSGSTTCIFYTVGLPDPNGLKYSGLGWTGSMVNHLRQIQRKDLKVGDLIIWGAGPGVHVCIVMKLGKDPLLFSHGSERGPIAITLSAENKAQGNHKARYYSAGC